MMSAIEWSRQTTGTLSDSTSGRAMPLGTGVTSPTQWLDRRGDSRLIGRMMRLRSPATDANSCIIDW